MTREELNAKLDKLYAKSDEVKAKIAAAKDETFDAVADKLAEAKGDVAAAKENLRETAELGKSKIGAEALKLQMTLEKVKDDFETAKNDCDEKLMSKLVEELDKYAADVADFAMYAMDEAVCAALEASEIHKEYEERFGK